MQKPIKQVTQNVYYCATVLKDISRSWPVIFISKQKTLSTRSILRYLTEKEASLKLDIRDSQTVTAP